jgi:hypothetical protein
MMAEPLIFTTKGNVPVSSLAYSVDWTVTDDFIKLTETYRDSAGEVVRESAHVKQLKGVEIFSAAGSF